MDEVSEFLSLLHRGSKWWYLATPAPGANYFTMDWRMCGRDHRPPISWTASYFSVNGLDAIPMNHIGKQSGKPIKIPRCIRAREDDITKTNCLFAEFDFKSMNLGAEFSRQTALDAVALRLSEHPAPSVQVFSGGGVHCYWLLDDTFLLSSEEARNTFNRLERMWVAGLGSDPAVKDLARVLRLPGTKNLKYSPARNVEFLSFNPDQTYSIDELTTHCNDGMPLTPALEAARMHRTGAPEIPTDAGGVIGAYNKLYPLDQEMIDRGYTIHDNGKYCRPPIPDDVGRNLDYTTKVSGWFDGDRAGALSSSDPMFVPGAGISTVFTSFSMLVKFEHSGDFAAALLEARRLTKNVAKDWTPYQLRRTERELNEEVTSLQFPLPE